MTNTRRAALAVLTGVSFFMSGLAAGVLLSDQGESRIPCGAELATSAEDDQCVVVPLWAVESK